MPACQRCLPWPCQLEFLLTGGPVNLAAGEGQASPLALCLDLLWEGPGLTHLSASPGLCAHPGPRDEAHSPWGWLWLVTQVDGANLTGASKGLPAALSQP